MTDDESIDVETGPVDMNEEDAIGGGAYSKRKHFEKAAVEHLQEAIDVIEGNNDDKIALSVSIELVCVEAGSVDDASQKDVVTMAARSLDPEMPVSIAPQVFTQHNRTVVDNAFTVGLRDVLDRPEQPQGGMAMGALPLDELFGGGDDDGGPPFMGLGD